MGTHGGLADTGGQVIGLRRLGPRITPEVLRTLPLRDASPVPRAPDRGV